MARKNTSHMIKKVIRRMMDPYFQGAAAELGFYFLFSLLPVSILLGQLLGIFSISRNVIDEMIQLYVVPEFASKLSQYLAYTPSGTMSAFFVIFALWAASKAQYSLIRISNYSYEHEPKGLGGGYFRERIRAVMTMMLMLFMVVFSLIILAYGEVLMDLAILYLNNILHIQLQISVIWYLIRWPVGIAVIFLIIFYNYHAFPYEKLPFRKVIPGSIFASFGILFTTWVYSVYASRFSSYDLLYGSMATIVALLFWFYLLGSILVIGIQVNIVWDESQYQTRRSQG